MHNLSQLPTSELVRLADFLLYHLSMETRRKLMAEMPIAYAKLFPTATSESILGLVRDALNRTRSTG